MKPDLFNYSDPGRALDGGAEGVILRGLDSAE